MEEKEYSHSEEPEKSKETELSETENDFSRIISESLAEGLETMESNEELTLIEDHLIENISTPRKVLLEDDFEIDKQEESKLLVETEEEKNKGIEEDGGNDDYYEKEMVDEEESFEEARELSEEEQVLSEEETLEDKPEIKIDVKDSKSVVVDSTLSATHGDIIVADTVFKNDEFTFRDTSESNNRSELFKAEFISNSMLNEWCDQVLNEGLVLIENQDYGIINKVVESISAKFDGYDHRVLDLRGGTVVKQKITIDHLLDNEIGTGGKMILVIDVDSKLFIDSLFVGLDTANNIKRKLKKKQHYLICKIPHRSFSEVEKNKGLSDFYFKELYVPYLNFLIRNESQFIDIQEKDLQRLVTKLNSLNEKKLDKEEKIEFFSSIKELIEKDGLLVFAETTIKKVGFDVDIEGQKELEDLIADSKLNEYVLFLITHFSYLRLNDFDNILSCLILSIHGEGSELLENWEADKDLVLSKCGISSRSLQFRERNKAMHAKRLIQERQFSYSKIIETIIGANVLGLIKSEDLYNECLDLLTTYLSQLDKDKLEVFFYQFFLKKKTIYLNSSIEIYKEEIAALSDAEIKKRLNDKRITGFLLKLMVHSGVDEKTLEYFLNLFINKKKHVALLHLIQRLQHHPGFDKFYWLRQLIERGSVDVSVAAYQFLIEISSRSSIRINEYFEQIQKWILLSPNSSSARMGISYHLDFALYTCYVINGNKVRINTYPIFQSVFEEGELNFNRKIKDVIKYIFHEKQGCTFYTHKLLKKKRVGLIEAYAKLLIGWFSILNEEKEIPKAQVLRFEALLGREVKYHLAKNEDLRRALKETLRRMKIGLTIKASRKRGVIQKLINII